MILRDSDSSIEVLPSPAQSSSSTPSLTAVSVDSDSSPLPTTPKDVIGSDNYDPSRPHFPKSPLGSISDILDRALQSRGPRPYDPLDRKSISRYEQA